MVSVLSFLFFPSIRVFCCSSCCFLPLVDTSCFPRKGHILLTSVNRTVFVRCTDLHVARTLAFCHREVSQRRVFDMSFPLPNTHTHARTRTHTRSLIHGHVHRHRHKYICKNYHLYLYRCICTLRWCLIHCYAVAVVGHACCWCRWCCGLSFLHAFLPPSLGLPKVSFAHMRLPPTSAPSALRQTFFGTTAEHDQTTKACLMQGQGSLHDKRSEHEKQCGRSGLCFRRSGKVARLSSLHPQRKNLWSKNISWASSCRESRQPCCVDVQMTAVVE